MNHHNFAPIDDSGYVPYFLNLRDLQELMGVTQPKSPPNSGKTPAPFLRWAGGKQLILRELLPHVVEDYISRNYHEPFLGAGSLFFALQPVKAHISDANKRLIECYLSLRSNFKRIATTLNRLRLLDSDAQYYTIRDRYNHCHDQSALQAARFIYLNRTCFNGIFRVNRSGHFNVPYGYKAKPAFPSLDALRSASLALLGAEVSHADFRTALLKPKSGDFLYLDPPYPPLNGTSYFTHYTRERFTSTNQEELAQAVRAADSRGCLFLMTNADTNDIRSLYRGYNITRLNVTRYITCKQQKQKVSELVIRNY